MNREQIQVVINELASKLRRQYALRDGARQFPDERLLQIAAFQANKRTSRMIYQLNNDPGMSPYIIMYGDRVFVPNYNNSYDSNSDILPTL